MTNGTKKIALTGGAAAAEAWRQINPDVTPVYPITPQTPIIQAFAKLEAKRKVDTEIMTVESEHSAMSACVGASAAGARVVTATSSQGLALMNEVLYIASGMRLPILMLVSARALSAPLNIHGDHSDVMGARDTGWIQIFCENAQEVYDKTLIGMKLAEKAQTPVMVIMDGFITSHSVENLEILEDETAKNFVGEFTPEKSLLNFENPQTFGAMALPEHYFDFKLVQDAAMRSAAEHFVEITREFAEISGRIAGTDRTNRTFEQYKTEDAEQMIVLAGSTAGTAKDVVDQLRADGQKVGLLKIEMFRPFPHFEIAEVLKNAKSIAVLDRAMSFGTYPPVYQEVVNSMYKVANEKKIHSYIYGLGGRDVFKKDLEKVFKDLLSGNVSPEIKYIGVK